MARVRPAERLDDLVTCAARVFTARGYRRAQMADVAAAMGVAPGTLYLYVESKEALFDLVVQRAFLDDGAGALPPLPPLPLPTPAPGVILEHVRQRVRAARTPHLDAALRRARPVDAEKELRGIAAELYANLARSHGGVRLIERSALDWPELAELWFGEVRAGMIARLTRYLEKRGRQKLLRAVPNVEATARVLLETIAWCAMHRHGDPDPPHVDEATMETAVVDFISHALLRRTR